MAVISPPTVKAPLAVTLPTDSEPADENDPAVRDPSAFRPLVPTITEVAEAAPVTVSAVAEIGADTERPDVPNRPPAALTVPVAVKCWAVTGPAVVIPAPANKVEAALTEPLAVICWTDTEPEVDTADAVIAALELIPAAEIDPDASKVAAETAPV